MTESVVTTANWSYKSCKAPNKWSPPTPVFYRPDALPVAQQCQSTEGKISHSMELLTPNSPGVFCLWPLIAPGYLGEGCHAYLDHQPSNASTKYVHYIWQIIFNMLEIHSGFHMKLVNSSTEFLYKTAWLINIVTVRYIPDAIMNYAWNCGGNISQYKIKVLSV